MDKIISLKRLSAIKLLYKHGLELSRKSDMISIFSILSFHDSIEMFLKLVADNRQIKTDGFKFMTYWDHIPELIFKGQMNSLNLNRNNIKHKGLSSSKLEIESLRVYTKDFFEYHTPIIFDLKFEDISLFDLLKFNKTKEFLKRSQAALNENEINECIEELTKAFHELLYDYKDNKKDWGYKTHFDFVDKISITRDTNINFDGNDNKVTNAVEKVVEKINKNFESLEAALEIIALGLDYRKYIKFKILTPFAFRNSIGDYHIETYGKKNWTTENCQFLIDFVLDSGLKLQEFDYDFDSLDITQHIFKQIKSM